MDKLKKEFNEKFCYQRFPYDNGNLRFLNNITNNEVLEWIAQNFLTKEGGQLDALVSQDFCGHFCKTCEYWQKKIFNDKHNYKQCINKSNLLFNRIIYSNDARRFGCSEYSKNSG